jgi:hypothetical protein
MKQIKITLEGPDRLEVFTELVELLRKPNVKTNLIIEEEEGLAFLVTPERSFEISTKSDKVRGASYNTTTRFVDLYETRRSC